MITASKTSVKKPFKLFGLVLSGGVSSRMGKDKGLINYHGIPQREYLYDLLNQLCDDVFLSVGEQQRNMVPEGYKTIVDQNKYKGPFNGMLSAFDTHSNVGWLVLACDLPLMDMETLQHLIKERDPDKSATAIENPESGEPEPLACIWEPKGLKEALAYVMNTDYPGPKKFLMHTDVKLIRANNTKALFNANSPSDYEYVKKRLLEREGS